MKTAGIIVAAGQGVRMGTEAKKQYMELAGIPILAHTLMPFENCPMIHEIFLVVGRGEQHRCKEKVLGLVNLEKKVHLVEGGTTRQESVFNGIRATDGRFKLVAIHDGVRPFVQVEDIKKTIEAASSHGAAIMAIPPSDTVKTIEEDEFVKTTLNRETVRLAQTPQVFYYDIILNAHVAARESNFKGTDDAGLVEKLGLPVKIIPGSPENIKITNPLDLKLAEACMKSGTHPVY